MSALVRAAVVGTVVFVACSLLSLGTGGLFHGIGTVVALALFVVGCVTFGLGYLTAVGRSRTEVIDLAPLFFLVGPVAPRATKRVLLGCYFLQIVVAVVVAGLGLSDTSDSGYNAQAFAILAPVYGQGVIALWAARHGEFPGRRPSSAAGTAADGEAD